MIMNLGIQSLFLCIHVSIHLNDGEYVAVVVVIGTMCKVLYAIVRALWNDHFLFFVLFDLVMINDSVR